MGSVSYQEAKFAEIVQLLGTQPAKQKSGEARRAPRTPCKAVLDIIPLHDGEPGTPIKIELIDISARGVGFMFDKDQTCGKTFVLLMPAPGKVRVPILTNVAHCRLSPDQQKHIAGGEFLCLLNQKNSLTPEQTAAESDRLKSSILD